MTRFTWAASLFLLGGMPLGYCDAAESRYASAQVDAMRAARDSDGFEMRIAMKMQSAAGEAEPIRISLIGQSSQERARLIVRVLSPAAMRDRSIISERVGDHVQSTAFTMEAAPASTSVDPTAGLFSTGLVAWDLLAPWWNWPEQVDEGPQTVDGHACTQVRSRPDREAASTVREVLSCVDARNGLAWRTALFDGHHRLLRSIEVTRSIRTQAGLSAVRSASVTDAQGNVTRIDVYSGDEHYQILPKTFSLPSGPIPARP